VVVAENLAAGELDARGVARKITAALAAPFQLAGCNYRISASIGVKIYQPGDSAESLLAAADQAMYVVKRGQALVQTPMTID
jgi:GGDEF domain-containing protein